MKEITGAYSQTSNFHGACELYDVRIGVGNRNAARKHLETQRFYARNVAHGAVRCKRHTAQRATNVRMDLPEQCTDAWRLVDILQDDDSWSRNSGQIFPEINAFVIPPAIHRWHRCPYLAGNGVSDNGWELRKPADRGATDKAFIARANIQSLYGIGESAGVILPQPFEIFTRKPVI